ncbi:MAG: cardiolipin synthase [Pirellulales bacterium]|nr:cardiolipin synthase [Pirellulales bacterium]
MLTSSNGTSQHGWPGQDYIPSSKAFLPTPMNLAGWITAAVFTADLMIRVGLSVRVIMRRLPVGATMAWLVIVLLFPFGGAIIYLLIGELRLGNRRAERAARLHGPYQAWLNDLRQRALIDWETLSPDCRSLAHLTEAAVGIPALPSNRVQLMGDWREVFRHLIADIDDAKRTCHMVFYIWHLGGMADQVVQALIRAAGRGVTCRVLIDYVGSRGFLKSNLARQLLEAKVQLHAALPGGLFRIPFARFDLRMHRKIVVIDGRVAYTGSQNMVDPRHFKQDAGVGQWIDAMIRIEGPAVESLAITFLEDWALETGASLESLEESGDVHPLTPRGNTAIQIVPSGPAMPGDAMKRVLLAAIYAAKRKLILTTPYFVPDEVMLTALISAAQRGVEVILVVPARVDSFLVRYASGAFKGDLVEVGVQVMLFHGGLLHTKSVTVDDEISLFGSLNLDPRSLHLNFEITAAIYDANFTRRLRELQWTYITSSTTLDLDSWLARPAIRRLGENAARLLGPLL